MSVCFSLCSQLNVDMDGGISVVVSWSLGVQIAVACSFSQVLRMSHVICSGTGRTGEREREHHIMHGSAYGHSQLDRYRHGHQLDMERKLTVTMMIE